MQLAKLSFGTIVLLNLFLFPSISLAQCDDGRVLCSHGCDARNRPACKDSKGTPQKPYCVTPGYCRDKKSTPQPPACSPGWSPRGRNCTKAERTTRGCQDARGRNGTICVRFTR